MYEIKEKHKLLLNRSIDLIYNTLIQLFCFENRNERRMLCTNTEETGSRQEEVTQESSDAFCYAVDETGLLPIYLKSHFINCNYCVCGVTCRILLSV